MPNTLPVRTGELRAEYPRISGDWIRFGKDDKIIAFESANRAI
jgi:hypothetical protein